jgi:hypothetical protein
VTTLKANRMVSLSKEGGYIIRGERNSAFGIN